MTRSSDVRAVLKEPANQELLRSILSSLGKNPAIRFLVILHRDGEPLMYWGEKLPNMEEFAAFAAAFMGTGERAISQLESDVDVTVDAKTERHRIHVAALGRELLLVTVTAASTPWDKVGPEVHKSKAKILDVLVVREGT